MSEFLRISDAEMEVLCALWENGGWMNIAEVCGALKRKAWKYNTVGTFLLRLAEKGVLESEKRGKANYYRPRISEAEYKRRETQSFLQEVHGGSMRSLIAALYDEPADPKALDELAAWLEKK